MKPERARAGGRGARAGVAALYSPLPFWRLRTRSGAMRIEGRCHCGNLGFELETARTWRRSGRASATAPSAAPTPPAAYRIRKAGRRSSSRTPNASSATSSGFTRRSSSSAGAAGSTSAPTPRKRTGGSRPSTSAPPRIATGPGAAVSYGPEAAESRRARRRDRWTPTELRLGVPPRAAHAPG